MIWQRKKKDTKGGLIIPKNEKNNEFDYRSVFTDVYVVSCDSDSTSGLSTI